MGAGDGSFRPVRRLPVVTEGFLGCQRQATTCRFVSCRYHLGHEAEFQGNRFRCTHDVTRTYPGGLPAIFVARIAGLPESEVQRTERTVAWQREDDWLPLRLDAFEDPIRSRTWRPRKLPVAA